VPLKNYRKVPVDLLAGKIVIDADNYYPERDGHVPELDNESTTMSELLQAHLPNSKATFMPLPLLLTDSQLASLVTTKMPKPE
jgi:hypothetical protein